ncbi:MAG: hypothetical protein LCH98_15770 [Actinobacteria bacterium]|nr:hypothetical protein [Actinomycetota bacterium]
MPPSAGLLRAARERLTVREVPIATIYLDDNASSHFRPLHDSARIYLPFLGYGLAWLAGFVVDLVLLAAVMALTGNLTASVVAARVVSGSVNFTLNRTWVLAANLTLIGAAVQRAGFTALPPSSPHCRPPSTRAPVTRLGRQ